MEAVQNGWLIVTIKKEAELLIEAVSALALHLLNSLCSRWRTPTTRLLGLHCLLGLLWNH